MVVGNKVGRERGARESKRVVVFSDLPIPDKKKLKKPNFKQFLRLAKKHELFNESPVEDFIEDALSDSKFRAFKKWDELENFLQFNGACDGALKAAKKCFKAWTKIR